MHKKTKKAGTRVRDLKPRKEVKGGSLNSMGPNGIGVNGMGVNGLTGNVLDANSVPPVRDPDVFGDLFSGARGKDERLAVIREILAHVSLPTLRSEPHRRWVSLGPRWTGSVRRKGLRRLPEELGSP